MTAIDRIYAVMERVAKGSVKLPVMPSTATVKSVSGNYATIDYRSEKDKKVLILHHNFKFKGVDAEGRTVTMTMDKNIKKGNKVFLAYLGGNFDSPIIVGRVP